MKKLTVSLWTMIGLTFAGCATLMNGHHQTINIQSNPEGARCRLVIHDGYWLDVQGKDSKYYNHGHVWIKGWFLRGLFVTPAFIDLRRGADYKIFCAEGGYKEKSVVLKSFIDWPAYLFGNLIYGGIPGWIIDYSGGGAYEFKNGSTSLKAISFDLTKSTMNIAPVSIQGQSKPDAAAEKR